MVIVSISGHPIEGISSLFIHARWW